MQPSGQNRRYNVCIFTAHTRQISQRLRETYEFGLDVCLEFSVFKLEECKEVRCTRQGVSNQEIHVELTEICNAALIFEETHSERKIEDSNSKPVGCEGVAKLDKMKVNRDLVSSFASL